MTSKKKESLATTIYKGVKTKKYIRYDEELHCTGILTVMMSKLPFISEFCRKFNTGRSTFSGWVSSKKVFAECYNIGYEYAHSNWVREYDDMKDNEEFNTGYWKHKGQILFQLGQQRRLKLYVKKDDTPYMQYKSIMEAASRGEYTSTELKQIMEAVMVGARAYESDELSQRLDAMESDIERGMTHNESNITKIEPIAKAH